MTDVSAKTVRAFFIENPDLVPANDKSVGPDSAGRGKLSAEAREVFAKHNKGKKYVQGSPAATVSLPYVHVQPKGKRVNKTVDLPLSEIRALVPDAPARGRLSAAHMEAAGEAYAAKVVAERGQKTAPAKADAPQADAEA